MKDNSGSQAMAQIQSRAVKDPEFRKALLANPAAALEEADKEFTTILASR